MKKASLWAFRIRPILVDRAVFYFCHFYLSFIYLFKCSVNVLRYSSSNGRPIRNQVQVQVQYNNEICMEPLSATSVQERRARVTDKHGQKPFVNVSLSMTSCSRSDRILIQAAIPEYSKNQALWIWFLFLAVSRPQPVLPAAETVDALSFKHASYAYKGQLAFLILLTCTHDYNKWFTVVFSNGDEHQFVILHDFNSSSVKHVH